MLNGAGKFIDDCVICRVGPNSFMVVHGPGSACEQLTMAATGDRDVSIRFDDNLHDLPLQEPLAVDYLEKHVEGIRQLPYFGHMQISPPVNLFGLDLRAKKHLMIAGGIGITPFIAQMAQLEHLGHRFELHHSVRRPELGAYAGDLKSRYGDHVDIYYDNQKHMIPLAGLLAGQPLGTHLRAYLIRFEELMTVPKWARRLHRVIRDVPEPLATYKGFLRNQPLVVEYLSQFDDGKPTGPGWWSEPE